MEKPIEDEAFGYRLVYRLSGVLAAAAIPGAIYLTFFRWETAWPWLLIPLLSWLAVAFGSSRVIGQNMLIVAIPATMIYGVVGFVLLVRAIF